MGNDLMKINFKVGTWALILAVLAGLSGGGAALLYQVNQYVPISFQILNSDYVIYIYQIHARMMVFFVLQPVLMVTFGSWFIPVLIGAKNFSYPFVNVVSILLLWLGFFCNFLTFFYPQVDVLSLFSLVFWAISSMMFSINVLVTFINNRGQNVTYSSISLFVWLQTISAGFLAGVSPVLLAALTRDYWNDYGLLNRAIDHTVQSFVFPIVVILVLPAFGIVFHIFQTVTEKSAYSNQKLISMVSISALVLFSLWNKWILNGPSWQTETYLNMKMVFAVGLYSLIFILSMSAIRLFKSGKKKLSTPVLWSLGCLFLLLFAWPYTGLLKGISQIHSTFTYAILLSVFAGFYFWMGKILGRQYQESLGQLHFYMTMTGVVLTLKMIPVPYNTVYIGDIFIGFSVIIFIGVILNAFYNAAKPVVNYWGKEAPTHEWNLPSPLFLIK